MCGGVIVGYMVRMFVGENVDGKFTICGTFDVERFMCEIGL